MGRQFIGIASKMENWAQYLEASQRKTFRLNRLNLRPAEFTANF